MYSTNWLVVAPSKGIFPHIFCIKSVLCHLERATCAGLHKNRFAIVKKNYSLL